MGEAEMEEGEDDMIEEEEEDIEKYLDDQDEEEEMKDQLKIPSDLEDGDDDDVDGGDDEEAEVDEDEEFGQFGDHEMENEVFNLAKENNEMIIDEPQQPKVFANTETLERIDRLEDQMVSKTGAPKAWQLTGETNSKHRPLNSLLAEHLDFNTVSKLPPTITQEKSTNIEGVIKQRILDELFDDPVRRYLPGNKKRGGDDDNAFDFTKSKKGLGELYEDDYRQKLL